MSDIKPKPPLNFFETDIERRFGFSSNFGTFAHPWFTGLIALVLTVVFYTLVVFLPSVSQAGADPACGCVFRLLGHGDLVS
jgi:hypothetical protein